MRHLNTVIDLQGEKAHVVSYVAVLMHKEPASIFFTGYYDDQFVELDGKWRIQSRKIRKDLAEIDKPKVKG